MFHLFRAFADRIKALFITNAALDFEGQFAARSAERKAELLREADVYDKEGLTGVAQELRQLADNINLKQPLANVLPSIEHWQAHDREQRPALTHATAKRPANGGSRLPLLTAQQKKRK